MTNKNPIVRIFFLAIAIVLLEAPWARADIDPAGVYTITKGYDADNNSTYSGKVKIQKRGSHYYLLAWEIPGAQYVGVGYLENNRLYIASSSDTNFGLVVYKVNGGKLSGDWYAYETQIMPGYENLEGPTGLNGTYRITSAKGDDHGDPYSGEVHIYPDGEVYHFSWLVDGASTAGIGILQGNELIVAWGPNSGVNIYDVTENELRGRWVGSGQKKIGAENLTRQGQRAAASVAVRPVVPANISLKELVQKIEKGIAAVKDITYDSFMGYWPIGGNEGAMIKALEGTYWYKKPDSGKSVWTALYMPDRPVYQYIYELEGDVYNAYEILKDGSIKKTSNPAKGWDESGATPARFYMMIKKLMAQNVGATVGFEAGRNVYVLKFNNPEQETFEIDGKIWLPVVWTTVDHKLNSVVTTRWSNIKINTGLSRDMFRVPGQ